MVMVPAVLLVGLLAAVVVLFVLLIMACVAGETVQKKLDQLNAGNGSNQSGPQNAVVVSDLESQPQTMQNRSLLAVRGEHIATTALERASTIRNPFSAMVNSIATESQIEALKNAEKLAEATGKAADAESKGIEALMRRADRLSEMHIRRELEQGVRGDRIEEILERLTASAHSRAIAGERRNKERLQTQRETLEAKHSLEATKKFKAMKFDLGLARARARQQDAEVDSKTAEAAVVKIASELSELAKKKSPNIGVWLDERIAQVGAAIEQAEADGEDTGQLRAELTVLLRLKATA